MATEKQTYRKVKLEGGGESYMESKRVADLEEAEKIDKKKDKALQGNPLRRLGIQSFGKSEYVRTTKTVGRQTITEYVKEGSISDQEAESGANASINDAKALANSSAKASVTASSTNPAPTSVSASSTAAAMPNGAPGQVQASEKAKSEAKKAAAKPEGNTEAQTGSNPE